MTLNFLASKQMGTFRDSLKQQYGADFDFSPYLVFESTHGKLFLISRLIYDKPITGLKVSCLGIYFAQRELSGLRLSMEGCFLLAPVAKKNIIELSEEHKSAFMAKLPIEISLPCDEGFMIAKSGPDILGPGLYKAGILKSMIPDTRTVRSSPDKT